MGEVILGVGTSGEFLAGRMLHWRSGESLALEDLGLERGVGGSFLPISMNR